MSQKYRCHSHHFSPAASDTTKQPAQNKSNPGKRLNFNMQASNNAIIAEPSEPNLSSVPRLLLPRQSQAKP